MALRLVNDDYNSIYHDYNLVYGNYNQVDYDYNQVHGGYKSFDSGYKSLALDWIEVEHGSNSEAAHRPRIRKP